MGRGSSKAGGGSGRAGTIENFERKIYQQDAEAAMIVTSKGETITFNNGDEHHVFGSEKDLKKMDGATATHNHPNNAIFSTTDVGNGIARGNLKEMRIVTKSGEVHSINADGATVEQRRAFSANYHNQTMKANNAVNSKLRRGEKVDRNEYVKNHMERWLEAHANDYGMSYKKGRVK